MQPRTRADTTRLLRRAHEGDRAAFDELYSQLYQELRLVARRERRRVGTGETLDTTGVVHDAYTRLVDETGVPWESRAHFLAIAARTMRRVLVDYARERQALKRGGGRLHVTLPAGRIGEEDGVEDVLALDEALSQLAAFNERLERIAQCRLFGDLTQEETAAALGVSLRTVQREWPRARAWLQHMLADP